MVPHSAESRNTIAEVLVFNAEDEDITYNYQIKEELGYLLVTDDGMLTLDISQL